MYSLQCTKPAATSWTWFAPMAQLNAAHDNVFQAGVDLPLDKGRLRPHQNKKIYIIYYILFISHSIK